MLRVVSWNVNGLRAALKQPHFTNWFSAFGPEILCLQEIKVRQNCLFSHLKAESHQVDLASKVPAVQPYHTIWNSSSAKKGYSGTLIMSKQTALNYWLGMNNPLFDTVKHFFS